MKTIGKGVVEALDPAADALAHRAATGALMEQRRPEDADREEMLRAAQRLASGGMSVDAALAAIDVSQQRLWSECVARASGPTAATVLPLAGSLLLSWHGASTGAVVETFRRLEQAGRLADRDRRAALLHGVLSGAIGPGDAPEIFASVAVEQRWRALRARPAGPATAAAVESVLRSAVEREGGHVATVAGEVYGIVTAPPRIRKETAYAGLGPAGDADTLPASFVGATRLVEAAQALDVRGVLAVEDLRLRLGVVEAEDVGQEVVRRCLGPLAGLGAFGRVLRETLPAYIENGARVDPTAAALGVHPNTVRHRLRRYREATGVDLERIEELVEVWWALEREGVDGRTRATPDAAQPARH